MTKAGPPARARYVEHLRAETAQAAVPWPEREPFDTVYLGGGTPSLLEPEALGRILESCRAHLAVAAQAWISLEANPEDVTAEACAAWRSLGVRTVSLGVQSFDDAELRFLGRRHTGAEARRAVELARGAGFDTVAVDLIYGLPGREAADWRRNLEAAIGTDPDHLSCYQLTVHPRTAFGVRASRGQLLEIPETAQAGLFEITHRELAAAGWPAYEVSNFARDANHQSRHNRKYWDHTPYLGLGPSAHSFSLSGGPRRWWNEARTPAWERRLAAGERPLAGEETLGPADLALEALMLGLRTTAGIDLDAFARRTGIDLVVANAALLDRLQAEGRATLEKDAAGARRLVLTLAGLAVADGLAAAFRLPIGDDR